MATKKGTPRESQSEKSWTWQEISEHNHRGSCWIYLNRDVYDVTKWLPKHPGGEELILLFCGRDCTEAFRAYHPFTDNPYAVIEKFKIGTLKGPSEFVRWKEDTGFYKTLRERCAKYFKDNNIDPVKREPWYEFWRIFSSVGMLLLYPWIVFRLLPYLGVPLFFRVLTIFPAAVSGVMIATNVGHMASHVPTFHMPYLNHILGWICFDVCTGLCWKIWLHEHVVGHHQYTNIITIDPNAPEEFGDGALYRSNPKQGWFKHFSYQYIWLPLVSFLLITEYRVATYRFWFKGFRKEIRVNKEFLSVSAFLQFVVGKIVFLIRNYYIPLFIWKVPLWECLIMMVGHELIAGYFVGITFPANHITNKVNWPAIVKDEKTGEARIDQEWAIMQIITCKDYAPESWIFTNIFGSLNNHSPHHLFPPLHHTHYYKIYPIVKQTCKDFNIPLPDVGTYWDLVVDYVKHLYDMGFDPKKSY